MKRSPLRPGRHRVGRRAAERREAGGKLAVGRASLSRDGLAALRFMLVQRADSRCERCGRMTILELHHAVPRSHGGADAWQNCVMLCRPCHGLVDAPYMKGRLMVWPNHTGEFKFDLVEAPDKAAYQIGHYKLMSSCWGGRAATSVEAAALAELR